MYRQWYQLPAATRSPGGATTVPFSREGDVLFVYRDARAYASFSDARDLEAAARLPGSRMLTPAEVALLDRDLPAPCLAATRGGEADARRARRRRPRTAGLLSRLLEFDEIGSWGGLGGWLDRLPLRLLGPGGRREW
jgi:hypothetical protein